MKTRTQKRLLDAFTACQAIESFVAGHTFADYEKDLLLRSAAERQFEIIGEALHQAEVEEPEVIGLLPELRLTKPTPLSGIQPDSGKKQKRQGDAYPKG